MVHYGDVASGVQRVPMHREAQRSLREDLLPAHSESPLRIFLACITKPNADMFHALGRFIFECQFGQNMIIYGTFEYCS